MAACENEVSPQEMASRLIELGLRSYYGLGIPVEEGRR
jgi:hypothetical protein